jgi:hypothetical protein
LGEKLDSVVTTSLRIITRLKKDWIFTGRRPDGICAAALLVLLSFLSSFSPSFLILHRYYTFKIAARAHKIFVSTSTVADLFRITGDTIKHRMEEFRATPSAQLTLEQFHCADLDLEFDPPCFIRHTVDQFYIQNNTEGLPPSAARTVAGYVDLALVGEGGGEGEGGGDGGEGGGEGGTCGGDVDGDEDEVHLETLFDSSAPSAAAVKREGAR